MKLQEVDNTISEGIMDMVKGIVNVGMAAAGSRSARENAENIYAKNNFRSTFVRKMSALLQSQWPQIQKKQEDYIQQQQFLQQQLKQKQAAMAQTGIKPAPIQPEAPGAPMVPNNAVSESYIYFNKLYKKALVEQAPAAQPQQPVLNYQPITMSDYLVKVIVQYMQGFDLNSAMQTITNFAKNVELTYKENSGVPALKKLGDFLYDLAAEQKSKTAPSPVAKPEEMSDSVERMLNNFKQMDYYDQKDFIAKVSEVAKKLGITS